MALGNDVVVIVFLGANQTAFVPTSHFNHVCLFVQPFPLANTTRQYVRYVIVSNQPLWHFSFQERVSGPPDPDPTPPGDGCHGERLEATSGRLPKAVVHHPFLALFE